MGGGAVEFLVWTYLSVSLFLARLLMTVLLETEIYVAVLLAETEFFMTVLLETDISVSDLLVETEILA